MYRFLGRAAFVAFDSPFIVPLILACLITFGIDLLAVPTVRLIERSVCIRYYATDLVGKAVAPDEPLESACKISEVQGQLAFIMGWKRSLDAIPALLTAVPYGWLANRQSRRLVLSLSMAGHILMLICLFIVCLKPRTLDTRLILLSSIFLLLGGGVRVASSIIFTLVSDSYGDRERAKYFFFVAAASHITRLTVPRTAAALMARDITIPFYVSIGTLGTCVVVPWLKPDPQRHGETSRPLLSADDDQAENYSNLQPNDTRHMLDNSNNTYETRPLDNSSTFQVLFRNILSFSQHEILVFCITGVTLWRLGTVCESFLPQYASEKFHWDLSQTTWLKLASSVGALISTVLLGPCLSHYFLQHGILAQVVNFRLAFSSLVALVISYLGAWTANSKYSLLLTELGIGLGEALEPALQALATIYIDMTSNAQLFTLLAVCETLADIVGGPIMAGLLSVGRSPGHPSRGLCFLFTALIFTVTGSWSFGIRGRLLRS